MITVFLAFGFIILASVFLFIRGSNDKSSFTVRMEVYKEPTPTYRAPLKRSRKLCVLPSKWPLPKYPSPLRGWTNLGTYEVHGINQRTKRSNKRIYSALTEIHAKEKASSEGLIAPFQVKEIASRPMSELQLKLLKKMKYTGSYEALSLVDAGAIISYVFDGDDRLITEEEWETACDAGYEISALTGPTMYKIIMSTGDWKSRIEND